MSTLIRSGLCAALLLAGASSTSLAQATSDDRIQKIEQRMDEMERRHAAELAERDRRIADLTAKLKTTAPSAGAVAPSSSQDLLSEIDSAGKPGAAGTTPDQTRKDVLTDSARRGELFSLPRSPVSFNPDIAVVADFLASYSSNHDNKAYNRMDIREAELDLRAAVHPNADGVAVLAFARDVENPVFPEGEEASGPEDSVAVEEAYIFLHDFGVPNLTAKLGRFHVRFGRQNVLHAHDLPTTDSPLVNQAFLAPEALSDSGLSLSYVIPPDWIGGQYVELIGEVLAGEGAGTESPTLRGDVNVASPAFNLHALWNHDLATNWNLEVGGTWLHGKAGDDDGQNVNLFGADFTLIHTDPTGGFFNQLLQAEAIYGDTYDPDGNHRHNWGAYVLAQQQINRDWFTGVRLDYTQDPNSKNQDAWAVSPYVSFYWSEFLRFRLQYQHKDGDVPSEDNLFFQCTWIFGAHPPHPYWAMR